MAFYVILAAILDFILSAILNLNDGSITRNEFPDI